MFDKSNEMNLKITVITPSYNQGKYIGETIESVLSQGVDDVEYLVFDAGSSDETLSVLGSFGDRLKWVSEPDHGQADAVNKGLRAARGDIIGWLNSDDIYYPGAFKAVLEAFDRHPEVAIIYGHANHIDEQNTVIEPYYTEEWDYDRFKDVCFICQPAVFFRRSITEKYGLLDASLRYCMDYEYWLRIGRGTPFFFLNQILAGSRLYADTKTLGAAEAVHEEIMQMFKSRFGKVPSRWIYNHAHVVARACGFNREDPDGNRQFVRKVIIVVLRNFMKYYHYVPLHELKNLLAMYVEARDSKGFSG